MLAIALLFFVSTLVFAVTYVVIFSYRAALEDCAIHSYINTIRGKRMKLVLIEFAAHQLLSGEFKNGLWLLSLLRKIDEFEHVDRESEVELHYACMPGMGSTKLTIADYSLYAEARDESQEALIRGVIQAKYWRAQLPRTSTLSWKAFRAACKAVSSKEQVYQNVLGCVLMRGYKLLKYC